jgi:hypothetical protein
LPLRVLEPVFVTVEPATTDAAAAVPRSGAVADQAGDAPKAKASAPAVKMARLIRSENE